MIVVFLCFLVRIVRIVSQLIIRLYEKNDCFSFFGCRCSRPLEVWHGLNGGSEVLLVKNSYDELGGVSGVNRGGTAALASDYSYNVRSWLERIGGSLFTEVLGYDRGGNIGFQEWTQEGGARRYSSVYDPLDRLTRADFSNSAAPAEQYGCSYEYDLQGNVTRLDRAGKRGAGAMGATMV